MRRLVTDRPIFLSRAAWSIAVFALWATLISVGILRFHLVQTPPGLAAVGASLFVAVIAICVAIGAFVRIWRKGEPGAGRALAGFLLGLAIIGAPVGFIIRGASAPPLNDVSTDLIDPPTFTVAASERGIGANTVAWDPANAAIQRTGFPQVQPLLLDLPPEETFALVLRLARERRWRILVQLPMVVPAEGERAGVRDPAGRIEAVDRTFLLGLEDDIAIRIRDVDGRTRVDMRSASRFGRYDQGVNGARIIEFLEAVRVNALIR